MFAFSITWYEWDNRGNLLSETNALRQTKRYLFDHCDRLTEAVLPGGKSVHITYDAEGQVTEYLDQAGRKTTLAYSPTGEVTRCVKPDGHSIGYEYDTEDRLTAVCNELNQRWIIHRDGLGQIVEERNWRGQRTLYRWNADGWLTDRTTPDGKTFSYRHDEMGRVTALCQNDRLLTRYEYNALGQITRCDNPYRRLEWSYDEAGRLVEEEQDAFVIRHFYSAQGHYAGRQSSSGNRVSLTHNEAGLLSQIQINDTPPVTLEYNILGMPVRERLTQEQVRELRYNEQGQLTARHVHQQNAPLFSQEWRYDTCGNVRSQLDSVSGETLFDYDISGQLTQCTDALGRIEHFIHDAAGNRLREEIHEGDVAEGDSWVCHAWSADDSAGLQHWYNRNGQLIKRQRQKDEKGYAFPQTDPLSWDEQGQLKTFRNDRITAEYGYDGLGRRVFSKTTPAGDNLSDIRWFWWDGNSLLCETHERTACSESMTQACELDNVNGELDRQQHLEELTDSHPPQEYVYYPHTFEPFALITGSDIRGQEDL